MEAAKEQLRHNARRLKVATLSPEEKAKIEAHSTAIEKELAVIQPAAEPAPEPKPAKAK